MRKAVWSSTLLVMLAAIPARADTVTKTDHLSVNGSLKQMSDGVITLEARFKSGTKTLRIAVSEVESIEFNDTSFNPGAPPKALDMGPPLNSAPPASSKQATAADTVVLRGGQRKECKLMGIDQQFVHCAGKDGDHYRRVTLRIVVGPR